MEQNQEKRFALLIDADNIGSQYIKAIMEEITNEGIVTYKRIYGDWTSPSLKPWKDVLLEYSITPMQQYSYTAGKNATDSAMIIDAMDILYSGKVDGFCLASSDSDFTKLAARLREAGMVVIGMGKKQTPRPFVSACSKFKYIDIISDEHEEPDMPEDPTADEKPSRISTQENSGSGSTKKNTAPRQKRERKSDIVTLRQHPATAPSAHTEPARPESSQTPEREVKASIRKFIDENSEENDGWVLISLIGNLLQKKYSDFDPKNYGYKKMMDLLQAWDFEIKRFQDPNNKANPSGYIMYVKDKS